MYIPPENGKPTDHINPHPSVFAKIARMIANGKYGPANRWLKSIFVSRPERRWIIQTAKNENHDTINYPRMGDGS